MNKISYAKKQDSEKIIALVHEVIDFSLSKIYPPSAVKWFYEYHSVQHLKEEFDDASFVVVAYDGRKLIGTATYYAHEIKRVFIHPEYQKVGLGKKFMRELEEKAKAKDDKYIILYANPKTWRYYEGMGYGTICITAWEVESSEYLAYCTMVKHLKPRGWIIKKADLSDASEMLAGQIKAFTEVAKAHKHMDMPPMTETEQEVKKAIKNTCVYIAKAKEKIIGAVRGEEKDGVCYVSRLWVNPSYQGKGIGHALMFAVEDAYDYLDTYKLFTGSQTPETITFYEERGYVETRSEPVKDYELVYFEKMNAKNMME